MKNANTPAMPLHDAQLDMGFVNTAAQGLTKREYFAAMAMQGLCAGYFDNHYSIGHIKDAAIEIADALLEEMERTNEPD